MVRMPGHPRARTHGYLFEHILVMEAKLGRMLFADESVYHKNGIRDDNSTEDLELWIRTHPSGMRALEAVA